MLNSLDDRLVFRCESSATEVNFLDIILSINNNIINPNIFYKEKDFKNAFIFTLVMQGTLTEHCRILYLDAFVL